MGSAQSSNVATAVANVSNFVSNSTTANTSQVNSIANKINNDSCQIYLSGNFDVNTTSDILQQNTQIITAKQDANVANNIQQQMLQEATSKVGMMGIGFASANNSCSEMVNASTSISNAMNAYAQQFSNTQNEWNCDNSIIVASNINIGFNTKADFISNQVLNNAQVADITNNISQTVQQKASATVEGLGSLLFMIALIIGIIVWGATKTLSSGGVKIATAVVIFALIIMIVVYMYLRSTPPFFAEPSNCVLYSDIGRGSTDGVTNECIDYQNQTINLSSAPIRYAIALLPSYVTTTGGNLLQMAIASASGQNESAGGGDNGGYRIDVMQNLETLRNSTSMLQLSKTMGVPIPPNPLYDPSLGSGSTGFYAIPPEYLSSLGGGNGGGDTQSSACTPGTIQSVPGVVTPFQQCPRIADPSQFTFTTSPSLGLANLNDKAWETYINSATGGNDTPLARSLFGRFFLCSVIGNIPLHIYVQDNEPVSFLDEQNNLQVGLASDYPGKTYRFSPSNLPDPIWARALLGGGSISGPVGVVNDKTYKFSKFMKNIGGYILLGLIGIAILILFYNWYQNRNSSKEASSREGNKE